MKVILNLKLKNWNWSPSMTLAGPLRRNRAGLGRPKLGSRLGPVRQRPRPPPQAFAGRAGSALSAPTSMTQRHLTARRGSVRGPALVSTGRATSRRLAVVSSDNLCVWRQLLSSEIHGWVPTAAFKLEEELHVVKTVNLSPCGMWKAPSSVKNVYPSASVTWH